MITLLVVQIIYAAICFLGAKQEYLQIITGNILLPEFPQIQNNRAKWLAASTGLTVVLLTICSTIAGHWLLLVLLPLVRVLSFDLPLNIMVRGRRGIFAMQPRGVDFYLVLWCSHFLTAKQTGMVKFIGAAVLIVLLNLVL